MAYNPWKDTVDLASNPVQAAKDTRSSGPADYAHHLNQTQQVINPMAYGTKSGTVVGDLARGDPGGLAKDSVSHAGERKAAEEEEAAQKAQGIYDTNSSYNSQLAASGKKYLDQMDQAHQNSNATYSNAILPNLKNLMEQSKNDASHAMTLQQYMDPNNAVAKSTRDLYETEAQGENKQNLANTGIMQAMGAQSFSNSLAGAGPMTGGQLQALMAGNQAQSGNQYMRSQQRVQDLRDTGLNMGFQQSQNAYNAGIGAQQRFGANTTNYGNSALAQQQGNEQNAGLHNAIGNQDLLRQQANDMQKAGVDMSAINAQIMQANAQQAAQANMGTAALGAVGTGVGAYFGGPAGAAAGNKIGTSVGEQSAQSGGSYGYQSPYANAYSQPSANPSAQGNMVEQGAQNPGFGLNNPYGGGDQIVHRQSFNSRNPYQRRSA